MQNTIKVKDKIYPEYGKYSSATKMVSAARLVGSVAYSSVTNLCMHRKSDGAVTLSDTTVQNQPVAGESRTA